MEWSDLITVVLFLVVLYVLWYSHLGERHIPPGSRLPPSPPAIPLIGHIYYHRPHFCATKAVEWARMYGHTYRIRTGLTEMVIVNDFEAIEKLFSKDELLYRSKEWRLYGLSVGLVSLSFLTRADPMSLEGEEWVENRRFCLQALRDIGFARPSVQNDILDECHRLIERISESDGQPIAIEDLILPSVSNNAVAPVFGESYPFDHPKRKWLDDTLRKLAVAVNTTRRITPLGSLKGPFLNTLAFPGRRDIEKHFRALGDFTRTEIDARRRSVKLPSSKTLIDAYLTKMAQQENDPQSKMSVIGRTPCNSLFNVLVHFKDECCENLPTQADASIIGLWKARAGLRFYMENLMSTAIGFFQAGSAGVPTYMNWHMINFALRADTLQAQVQAEIDRVVGSLRRPTWEDRARMPLTMAVVWEMLRWKAITPLSAPRRAAVDFTCDGFFYPAGTTVMANFWAVHNDPSVWPDPEKFDPGRFLNEDGSATCERPKRILSFSLGKRKCPAETQAIMVIFLYITSILQNFRVLPEDGVTIDIGDENDRLPSKTKYRLRFIPRRN